MRSVEDAIRFVASRDEDDLRDEVQGLCFLCGEGWEMRPGPRGGVARPVHTNRHADDCPVVVFRDWVTTRTPLAP